MKIYVVATCYESDICASTHLTRKGAYLRAVESLWEFMGADACEDMEDFWRNRMGYDGEDDEIPKWEWDYKILRTLSADALSEQYAEMCEFYWDAYAYESRVDIEVCHTTVAA
tara:strand:+ start:31581 stop:31919 length:339 start_codon:yes stop_codon:yes gene_type:complete